MISFRLLGHVSIDANGRLVYANGSKMWTVAAMLALEPNRTIPLDRLIDEVWPNRPPASAVANIRTYISYVRRMLGSAASRLTGHGIGYRLDLAPHELDVGEFERLVADGRAALGEREPATSAELLNRALALFSGPALMGVRPGNTLTGVVGLLEEERLGAIEDLHDAELAIGRHAPLVRALRRHVAMHPLRERGWAQLMTALYRCGDAASALAAYGQARMTLVSQLGIEPGLHLRQLQHAMLRRAPELDLPAASALTTSRPESAGPLRSDRVLIGRKTELDTVAALIRARSDAPLVIGVHGPTGVGVSALVGAVARTVADDFPTGVVHLDLARGPDAEVRPPTSGRCGLLVLDHADDDDRVATLIAAAAPDVTLIGAQRPPRSATHYVSLAPLTAADATELLRVALGDAPVGWDPTAADEIVQHCAGMPLAVLAAASLARGKAGTLATLAKRLEPECDRLRMLDVGELSLRRQLDRDVARLSVTPTGRRAVALLRELGRRDVSSALLIDAARWMRTSTADIERLVGHLAGAALMETDRSGRCLLRPLVRIFAGELARADNAPAAMAS